MRILFSKLLKEISNYYGSRIRNYIKTNSSEFLRNTCNNTLQNASALYTPSDAVEGGTHIKNPKPSKECTYGMRKSGRILTYRKLYIVDWLVQVCLVGVYEVEWDSPPL